MHVFGGVAKNKVRGAGKICTLRCKEIWCALQWGEKLPGHHLLQQGLMKINVSCPDFSCVWCIVYDESDRMLYVSLSRVCSFIYDACGAGLAWRVWYHQRAPQPWRWPWAWYPVSYFSLSLSLCDSLSGFSLSRSVSYLFIYLTVHETT